MFGNPIGIRALKGLDLVLGGPVKLLARNVVVDLRRTLAVRAVGAAQIRGVRNPGGTILPRSAAEAAPLGTWTIELAGTALGAIAEAAPLPIAFTARTITERFAITITVAEAWTRIAFTARTITERFAITITVAEAWTRIAFTART
ncbi:hypothetical protein, partial [Arthrobacter bambusae]|uniref:hypothetical protein n=1 Tax=Arthrobacter bambusae TaxID=1338426 RepID=UPI00278572DF